MDREVSIVRGIEEPNPINVAVLPTWVSVQNVHSTAIAEVSLMIVEYLPSILVEHVHQCAHFKGVQTLGCLLNE